MSHYPNPKQPASYDTFFATAYSNPTPSRSGGSDHPYTTTASVHTQQRMPAYPSSAYKTDDDDDEQSSHAIPYSEASDSDNDSQTEKVLEDDIDNIELPSFDDSIFESLVFKHQDSFDYKTAVFPDWHVTYFANDYSHPQPLDERIRFMVYTKEICPTSRRVHFHIYVELKVALKLQAVQAILNTPNAHCEPRHGTRKQAFAYCTKKRSRFPGFVPVVIGDPKQQGHRSDLDSIYYAIMQGATHYEVLKTGGSNALRYGGMIDKGLKVVHGQNSIDHHILAKRKLAMQKGISPMTFAMTDAQLGLGNDKDADIKHFNEMLEGKHAVSEELQAALKVIPLADIETVKPKKGRPKKEFNPLTIIKQYKDPTKGVSMTRAQDNLRTALQAFVERVSNSTNDLREFYHDCVYASFKPVYDGAPIEDVKIATLDNILNPIYQDFVRSCPNLE